MTTTHRIVSGMTAIVFAAALSGCASAPATPTIYAYPAQGQTPQKQAQDGSECQTWAKQQSGWDPATSTAKGAGIGLAIGALTGAAAGAAIGAATGHAGTGAAIGAAAGGVGGAAYGGTSQYGKGQAGYDQAFGACMSARGYTTK
ncbi:MAG: glycine zipper domain-containing protein [Candidatus Rokubacteria bacterium]|nr:glycine zipper domain-containing protein [Candidatus Rokubacteria bacterium]